MTTLLEDLEPRFTEKEAAEDEFWLQPGLCGIDEAGRGPLAGPVVAAAVILPEGHGLTGLDDSKKLTAKRREALFRALEDGRDNGNSSGNSSGNGIRIGVGIATVAEIDDINILQASLLAMKRAVFRLGKPPIGALIDGNKTPKDMPCPARALVGGDGLHPAISAASIVAKVTRDRMMMRLHDEHPAYGWNRNMGYGTAEHRSALKIWGATAHHRTTFAPVREILG